MGVYAGKPENGPDQAVIYVAGCKILIIN